MKGLTIVIFSSIILVLVVVLFISQVQDGSMATAFVASEGRIFKGGYENSTFETQVNSITSAQMIDPPVLGTN